MSTVLQIFAAPMKQTIIILLLIIFIGGCRKKDNDRNLTIPLVKSLSLSWSAQTGKDRIDFSYDSQFRVTQMNAYNYYQGNGPAYDSIFRLDFYYTGNNRLPSTYTYSNPHIQTQFHKFNYDLNGRLIEDSTREFAKRYFEYAGEWIIIKNHEQRITGSLRLESGNFTYWGPYPTPGSGSESFEFDTGLNPLNSLNIAPVYFAISEQCHPAYSFWSVLSLCNKNNIINQHRNYSSYVGGYLDSGILKPGLSYDINGLLQKRIWYMHNGVTPVDTISFIYH